jgi:hypothetical protein
MAIHSTPLLVPDSLPPIPDGVEFYICECHNVLEHAAADRGDAAVSFRAATVLVGFLPNSAERAAFAPLRSALSFGRVTSDVCDGSDWLQKLSKRLLASLEPASLDSVTVTLCVGSSVSVDPLVSETVQTIVDLLSGTFGEKLALTMLVSTTEHHFASLRGIDGFVTGVKGRNAETARSMFLCLAMFLAPNTLNGLDLIDLKEGLGTIDRPAVLADAIWMRSGEGRILFATPEDQAIARTADFAVAVPLANCEWGWTELRRLRLAVDATTPEARGRVTLAANGALAPTVFSASVWIVPLLCRSRSRAI